jgi:hypothetical protein
MYWKIEKPTADSYIAIHSHNMRDLSIKIDFMVLFFAVFFASFQGVSKHQDDDPKWF